MQEINAFRFTMTARPRQQDKEWRPQFGVWEVRELSFFRYYEEEEMECNPWYVTVGQVLHDVDRKISKATGGGGGFKMNDVLWLSDAKGKRFVIDLDVSQYNATADCNGWTHCRFRIRRDRNASQKNWIKCPL